MANLIPDDRAVREGDDLSSDLHALYDLLNPPLDLYEIIDLEPEYKYKVYYQGANHSNYQMYLLYEDGREIHAPNKTILWRKRKHSDEEEKGMLWNKDETQPEDTEEYAYSTWSPETDPTKFVKIDDWWQQNKRKNRASGVCGLVLLGFSSMRDPSIHTGQERQMVEKGGISSSSYKTIVRIPPFSTIIYLLGHKMTTKWHKMT